MGVNGKRVRFRFPLMAAIYLSRIEHVRWSGDEILVMNSIAIKPPYLPENCQNLKENQQEALTLVRKLVSFLFGPCPLLRWIDG